MKPQHIAMGVALAAAAALVIFGDNKPDSDVAEAVERKPARAGATTVAAVAVPQNGASKSGAGKNGADKSGADPAILRLTPRASLIGSGDDAAGQDVFGRRDWNPPPPPPPPAASQAKAPPPPPPMAPPLPFTVLGKAAAAGSWEVFLAIGDKTYIARDKMVIDGIYRVDAIAPPTLTLTYLPLNQVQQLNIGVLD
jgi:hypothetical protein